MNERIQELRRQATLVETYTAHNGSIHEGKSVDLEKFAELIVKECCNVVDYDNARAITNHFGNKEEPPVGKSRDLMKGLWKV